VGLVSAVYICVLAFGICQRVTSSSRRTKAEAEK